MLGAAEFKYRVPWRTKSGLPGSHHGIQRGAGYEIHGTLPFHLAGDPRRFDLRASMRDPFGQLLVRVYKQKSTVPVIVLGDVSASMGFVGNVSKFDLLIEFVECSALSAHRAGDPFAFTACDTGIRAELSSPLSRGRWAGALAGERLRRWAPRGADAAGLLAGAGQLPAERSLVFVVSDYHLPIELVRRVLDRLLPHAVVPVVLVDSAEERMPGIGICHVYDPETMARRTLLMRRSLAKRFERNFSLHREQLNRCFAEHDLRPLYVIDRFDAEEVTRYFHE